MHTGIDQILRVADRAAIFIYFHPLPLPEICPAGLQATHPDWTPEALVKTCKFKHADLKEVREFLLKEQRGTDDGLTTPPPAVRLRRKSSHRPESADTLKVGESQDTLPTDPALQRATTCEQALATPHGTPTPTPTGSATEPAKRKTKNKRLRKMKSRDIEPEQSPPNQKALPLYPSACSPPKRPRANAKAKGTASQVLKRPAMAAVAPGSSRVKGDHEGGSGASIPKAGPKAKATPKAKPKPKVASRKRKQPDDENHDEGHEEQKEQGQGNKEEGQTQQDEISEKAKRAHKLYMRYWRNLRSQGLNILFMHDSYKCICVNQGRNTPSEIKDLSKRFKYCLELINLIK
eukprot:s2004_g5.t1